MKDQETIQRFVQLRAQGKSFARIAQELDVSRLTLINWSRKLQFEIQNQRAIELEALREELLASREARARALADQLRQVEAELQKRNLADLSTSRLFSLADRLRHQILSETGELKFSIPTRQIPLEEFAPQVQDWTP
ncbi:MAG TPA: hypothetical protein VNT26_02755 [Candidatus Sulfotelmatobacter sp.]|nr:hypothetical protein [Candidatus Sulfotelmatobacter sp.]